MLARFSSSMGVVGVDFGARGVRMIQIAERGGSLQVIGAGRVELPREGEADPKQLTDQLRAAFTSGGFTGRKCVVSLPRCDVHVQAVRLPKMPDGELHQAAIWEATQRFNIPKDQIQADFIRTGAPAKQGDTREEILIVATSHEAINRWIDPLFAAGLRPAAIEADFTAIARAYSRQYRRDDDRAIVRAVTDIGGSGSTVTILRGDQIAFCKPIGIGSAHFDKAVAEHLQIELRAASELRAARIAAVSGHRAAGPITDEGTDRAVFEAVRPLIGELVKEVLLCLRYYGVTFRGNPPERLIVTGGDGLEPRLAETLAETCKLPVDVDDQAATLESMLAGIRTMLNRDPGPATCWAVAVGLSLRGLERTRTARRRDDPPEPVKEAA